MAVCDNRVFFFFRACWRLVGAAAQAVSGSASGALQRIFGCEARWNKALYEAFCFYCRAALLEERQQLDVGNCL